MGLLLHISDLHLGVLGEYQDTGDYKVPGIPRQERENRLSLYKASLSALADRLSTQGENLDCVVVTGDVAIKYDAEGFGLLSSLLDELADKRPPNEQVLVVPGNHDVLKDSAPSHPDRYGLFLEHVRGQNFRTPLLEGVDIDEQGNDLAGGGGDPIFEASDKSFVVVLTNSANYSAGRLPLRDFDEDDIAGLQTGHADDEKLMQLFSAVAELRRADIARVSPGQLSALGRRLMARGDDAITRPVRVAALHHHLLPVTQAEEFKTFESLTNLGAVRQFLADHDFSLVLHGHKHAPQVYLDQTHVPEMVAVGVQTFRRRSPIIVSSAATIGDHLGVGSEIARLVRVDPEYRAVRKIDIDLVPAVGSGARYPDNPFQRIVSVVSPRAVDKSNVAVLEGDSVDDVYEQLLALYETESATTRVRNLICRVGDGTTALVPPQRYPFPPAVEDGAEWFKETLAWWQKPDPSLRRPLFNHGARIHRYRDEINQIDDVVSALTRAPHTTRGVVLVIDPGIDEVANPQRGMPSFCVVQFLLDLNRQRVDAVAYFRKQQMRMWWPVNVGEVASLLSTVVERLRGASGSLKNILVGEIVTIAAVAVGGMDRPRVIVPRIDRLAEEAPEQLWSIALDLLIPRLGFGSEVATSVEALLSDWEPTGPMDPDGVPIALSGIDMLEKAVRSVASRQRSSEGERLADVLRDLYITNNNYALADDMPREQSEREYSHSTWSEQVRRRMHEIRHIVASLLGTIEDGLAAGADETP